MSFRRQTDTATVTANSSLSATADRDSTLLNKVRSMLDAGRAEEAFNLLRPATSDPILKNARGVCLMRMGQPALAVRVYREICLSPGGISLRPEVPVVFKTNFATALMLDGNIAGGVSTLSEIGDPELPQVQALKQQVSRWVSQLSLWQRLLWWLGADPKHPIDLGPTPGDLK